MVLWFIGMSGSGKTTISKQVYSELKKEVPNLVRLDGDVIRDVFGHDVDHTVEGRRRNAERISMLCRMLHRQDIHVVAAVLSIFPEWQQWNREQMPGYSEVYLKTSMETLRRRDTKGLYRKADSGEISNVVGVDIPFPEPPGADLVIENDEDRENIDELVRQVLQLEAVRDMLERV
ncbi:MAG: adenylyl-sulfate kinase [Balneolaceae bacterium]